MVGPEYESLFADVRMNGRNLEGENWSPSLLKNGFTTKALILPDPMPLLGCKNPIPNVCTGDNAFFYLRI